MSYTNLQWWQWSEQGQKFHTNREGPTTIHQDYLTDKRVIIIESLRQKITLMTKAAKYNTRV